MAEDRRYSSYHIVISFGETSVVEADLEKIINRLKKRILKKFGKKNYEGVALIGASVDNCKLGDMSVDNIGKKNFISDMANYEKTQPHIHIGVLGYGASEIAKFVFGISKKKYGIAIARIYSYNPPIRLAEYIVNQSFLLRTVIFNPVMSKVSDFVQTAYVLDKKIGPRQVVFKDLVKNLDASLMKSEEEILRELKASKTMPTIVDKTEELTGEHVTDLLAKSAPAYDEEDLPFGPDHKVLAKSEPATDDEDLPFGPDHKVLAKSEPATDDEDLPFGPDIKWTVKTTPSYDDEDLPFDPDDTTPIKTEPVPVVEDCPTKLGGEATPRFTSKYEECLYKLGVEEELREKRASIPACKPVMTPTYSPCNLFSLFEAMKNCSDELDLDESDSFDQLSLFSVT